MVCGSVSSDGSFSQPCSGKGEKRIWFGWCHGIDLQAEINGSVSALYCFRAGYPEEKKRLFVILLAVTSYSNAYPGFFCLPFFPFLNAHV